MSSKRTNASLIPANAQRFALVYNNPSPHPGSPMEPRADRYRLYLWLRSCLIGERLADARLAQTQPLERCHTGILFPLQPGAYGEDVAADLD